MPDTSPARFPTTRRSIVAALASGDAADRARAFDTLVSLYWRPLYKYARIGSRCEREDAEDLTQSFLARMLESGALASYDPSKASFRTFLRTLFDRHIANERKSESRLKRGGGQTRLDFDTAEAELANDARSASPEELFEREWGRSVFSMAVERLRERINPMRFGLFEAYDLDANAKISYRELAARFGIPETSVTNNLVAARREFRSIVLEILRESAASDDEYRREVRALLGSRP